MTPDTSTTEGKIAVMQAAVDGKSIQVSTRGREKWSDAVGPWWDWSQFDYRIKPAEPLRLWVNAYQKSGSYAHESEHRAVTAWLDGESGRKALPVIEITPEVEAALKAAGIL